MEINEDGSYKPIVADVNGMQVFSADFVFEQMSSQGCRIDTAKIIAIVAVIISLISVGVATYALIK